MAEMNDKYEKYGNEMDDSLRKISAIQSLVLGKELSDSEVETIKEFKSVQDYLDAPNNSKEETAMKKMFCYAIIAGMETGSLPFDLPTDATPESIVSIVDEGLTRIKVGYQLEEGLIEDEYEADEIIIEHQAVRIETFTEMAIEKSIEFANLAIDKAEREMTSVADMVLDHSDAILSAVEAAFPETTPVVEFCKQVVNNLKPTIREKIHKGISAISTITKSWVESAIKKVPSLLEEVKQYLLA